MNRLSDPELWEYIREDIPHFDLTTHLLDLPQQRADVAILTREPLMTACTEEAARVAELLGCEIVELTPSRRRIDPGATLLQIRGAHEALHQAFRLCQILLEYACALATQADAMLRSVRAVNPACEILTTRKSFPFAKRFCVRALLCGGVLPHRLGLSESVLLFEQHRLLLGTQTEFETHFRKLKTRCVEKKVVVEARDTDDARYLLQLGADVIQMDKCAPETLSELMEYKRNQYPQASILAAGGIDPANAEHFAATGVDALVTSSLYQAKMADLTAKWTLC